MPFGVAGRVRARALLLIALCAAAGCSGAGVFRQYEYEEELYLALDGSVTVNVNASVAALVALRGVDLDPDPTRTDRPRSAFARSSKVLARAPRSAWRRRDLRRFVHASVESGERRSPVDARAVRLVDVSLRTQGRSASSFDRWLDRLLASSSSSIRWTGDEIVAFRLHLPSEIVFHNAPSRRGRAREHSGVGAAACRATVGPSCRDGSPPGNGIDSLHDAAAVRLDDRRGGRHVAIRRVVDRSTREAEARWPDRRRRKTCGTVA